MANLAKLSQENGETLCQFRQRHSRIVDSMQKSRIDLPNTIVFRKALASMKLSSSQISILIDTLESQQMDERMKDLWGLSAKLSGRNFIDADDRIPQLEEVDGDGLNPPLSESGADNLPEDPVRPFMTDYGECFEIRKIPSPM